MKRQALKGDCVSECRRLGSEGIWTHVLGGGHGQNVEKARGGLEIASGCKVGQRHVQSNS